MSRRAQRAVDTTALAPAPSTSARTHKRAATASPSKKAKHATSPRDGLLGCRAPGGGFAFAVRAWPPAKSNKYRIFQHGATRTLGKSNTVTSYEAQMQQAIVYALHAIEYHVEWYMPAKRKTLRPLNPLFGADCEVDVTLHLYEPVRTNADTDDVAKLVLDVITQMGVWWDDRQVGDVHIVRASHVGERTHDELVVELSLRDQASFATNPSRRPVARRTSSATPASSASSASTSTASTSTSRRSPRKRVCA